ncbi:MAG: GGDEF domain-containing protein [Lysobacter sp.]|nr:GGDEF domain-containing protein [Lysobacter sp.]
MADPARVPMGPFDTPAEVGGVPVPGFDDEFERLDRGEIWKLDAVTTERRLVALAALVPPGDTHRALLYQSLRCNWGYRNDVRAQQEAAEEGLARAVQAGDREAQVRFRYCRAGAREQITTPQDALGDYIAGIDLARAIENPRLVADGLAARGGVQSLLGEQGHAVLDLLAAQRLYERAGDRNDADANVLNIAVAYRRMGDHGKAAEYLAQSEQYAVRSGDWTTLLSTLMQQGYLAEDENRPEEALARYQRALVVAQQQSSRSDIATAHLGMALPLILQRQYAQALQLLARTQLEFDAAGDRSSQGMLDLRRGQAHAGLGQHERALADYARAAVSIERGGNLRYQAMLYEARAVSDQALGHSAAAVVDLNRYIAAHEAVEQRNHSQQAEVLRYQVDAERSELENRRLSVEKAARDRQLAALLNARRWQWTALALGGLLLAVLGALVMRQFDRVRRLRELASTDPLTGVANRRSIELHGEAAMLHARALGHPLSVLILDVDHFKRINDACGHLAGDQVLAQVARACQEAMRQHDRLGRIGGEEFLVVLPSTRLAQAHPIAERLREAVAAVSLDAIGNGLKVTASIGVAELQATDADLKALLQRADLALYAAKAQGRDRVQLADTSQAELPLRAAPAEA